jgi:2-dehydro-3-deoxyphosphogluconate aldolase / (4S)-4-hydroxy-2-oxoglutarate aldolase
VTAALRRAVKAWVAGSRPGDDSAGLQRNNRAMHAKTDTLLGFARRAPVIPVLTIEDAHKAVPLARTLVEAGLPVVEVTLRTGPALDAIRAITDAVSDAVVAAGTVTAKSQIGEVKDAGAAFIVTPGTPPRLAEALAAAPLPAMPGCATVSEAMMLAELGFATLKFFPAAASGGLGWLKAVAGPLPHLQFCPTGGVDAANAGAFLALPNVVCVGGSWMAPPAAIAAGDLAAIGRLARAAAALLPATASSR